MNDFPKKIFKKKKFFDKSPTYYQNRFFRTKRNTTVEKKLMNSEKKFFKKMKKIFKNRKIKIAFLSKNEHSCEKKSSKIPKKFFNNRFRSENEIFIENQQNIVNFVSFTQKKVHLSKKIEQNQKNI